MKLQYPMTADGTRPLDPEERGEEVRYHVREVLESTLLAIRASDRREEFSPLLGILLAAKEAEVVVGR